MKTDRNQNLDKNTKGVAVKTNLKAGRTSVGPQGDLPVRRY